MTSNLQEGIQIYLLRNRGYLAQLAPNIEVQCWAAATVRLDCRRTKVRSVPRETIFHLAISAMIAATLNFCVLGFARLPLDDSTRNLGFN